MGVFGLTIPEAHGGMGLGKVAMCVVSEELSRGYIGRRLPRHPVRDRRRTHPGRRHGSAEAEVPPQARERRDPADRRLHRANTGSDLASCAPRATRDGDDYFVSGAKTWITHPVRADLMTLLVRTNLDERGYRGLSMLLAREATRQRRRSVPGRGHVRGRN